MRCVHYFYQKKPKPQCLSAFKEIRGSKKMEDPLKSQS